MSFKLFPLAWIGCQTLSANPICDQIIRRKVALLRFIEAIVSMLKLAGTGLTGDFHGVRPARERCLWGRQLGFGSHVSHSTLDKMTPN